MNTIKLSGFPDSATVVASEIQCFKLCGNKMQIFLKGRDSSVDVRFTSAESAAESASVINRTLEAVCAP